MSGDDTLLTGPLEDRRDPAEIVEGATVWQGRVFDVNRETARFHGGEMVREYTVHHGAVAVLAIDEHDRVLLINQYRHPVRSRLWEIPAGLLDVEGEDPLAAAKRELAEETDLVADEWSDPITFYPSPGQSGVVATGLNGSAGADQPANGSNGSNGSSNGSKAAPPGEATIVLPSTVYGSVYGRRSEDEDDK